MKLFEGYTGEGRRVEISLEDGQIWITDTESGEKELYNDGYYTEDDTCALASVKASMIMEGYRL